MARKKIDIEKLSSREKALLVAGVCVVLILFCEKLVVTRVRIRLQDMGRQIKTAESEIRGNDRILQMRDEVDADYAKFSAYVMEVPEGRNPVDEMFTRIDEIASFSNIRVVGEMKEMAKESGDFFAEYSVKIDVVGTMADMIRFLHRLEISPELLRVKKLDLAPAGGEKSIEKKATLTISRIVLA